jgi:hypothetical protein
MNEVEKLMKQLTNEINEQLDLCDISDTPYLCSALSDMIKRQMIVNKIIDLVSFQGLTISSALVLVESELNPKYTLD